MQRPIRTIVQFEHFKAELSEIPVEETRFNLERRLRGSAMDYLLALREPQGSEDDKLTSLLSHVAMSLAQVSFDQATRKREQNYRDLAWIGTSRSCITAIGSEIGIPETWLARNIIFSDDKNNLLHGLSRLACAYTEPAGAYSGYEIAAGVASGQVGFDAVKFLQWRAQHPTQESQ